MKLTMPAVGLVAALLISACAAGDPQLAEEGSLVTRSAVVEAVDPVRRSVRLRDEADGTTFTVTAGPEVRNFAQIARGDRIELDLYESTVLEIADPGDDGAPLTVALGERAAAGERPGGGALVSTSLVVEVVSYDPVTGEAVFRLPDGTIGRSTLAPGLRAFAERRRPGERVLVTITDAVAVSMTPSGA